MRNASAAMKAAAKPPHRVAHATAALIRIGGKVSVEEASAALTALQNSGTGWGQQDLADLSTLRANLSMRGAL